MNEFISRNLRPTYRPPSHISASQEEASNSASVAFHHCLSRREEKRGQQQQVQRSAALTLARVLAGVNCQHCCTGQVSMEFTAQEDLKKASSLQSSHWLSAENTA